MKRKVFTLFAVLFTAYGAMAQGDSKTANHTVQIVIPEVALLDIEGSPQAITLTAVAPTEAGNAIDMSATNSTLWLNYSSIKKTSTDASRTVSAQVTSGTIPGGMDFKVIAAADASGGEGTVGTPSAILTLSTSAQNIITGVGSAYTGTGTSKGHQLTYSMAAKTGSAYGDLDADDSGTLTVTYTLSDN